jgi:biotin transport system substrate-specific component
MLEISLTEVQRLPKWAKNLTLILGASLFLGIFAYVSIPLPFTPVPIVMQSFLVLLFGVLLGSKRASAAVATFIAQGCLGLPVFAGGASGLAVVFGPRGGYLLGYLVAAYVVGRIMELSGKPKISHAFQAMLAGNVVIFLFGAAVLSFFVGGVTNALMLGVVPFVLGDILKLVLGSKLLQWIRWDKQEV